MRIVHCEQGSDGWLKAREGRITASRVADVLNYKQPSAAQAKASGHALVRDAVAAGIKGEESQARSDYRIEIMAERLTGLATEAYVSPEMKWGTEHEPDARTAYELKTGNFLDRVGFVLHPWLDYFGASPDGICGKGGAEFKCPKSTTHLRWMMAGVVPPEHIPQMDAEMVCCELDWLDFVSFDPRMIEDDLQMFTVRLPRDEKRIAAMVDEVVKLEDEIESQIGRLRGRLLGAGVQGVDGGVRESQFVQSLRRSLDEVGDTRI